MAEHFLDEPAGRHPERVAIAGEPREVTYAGLAALSSRVGSALLAQGVTRGDRVLILLPDSAEFIAAFFGAAKIGAIAVPVNPFARTADYIHYIENSAPRAAIVYSEALEEFLPASSERAQMPIVLVGDEEIETGGVTCAKWRAWTGASSERLAPAETSPHDPAFFLYTSGSGGKPKAAVHRHADMLVTSQGFARGVLDLHKEDVTFSVSKLFFAYGLGNGMYFPLSVGARTVLNPERTKVDRVIEMVTRYRPTVFFAVPTFYAAVLRAAEAERDFRTNYLPGLIRSVEEVTIGGVFSRRLPDQVLNRTLEDAWARECRSPSNMMQELAARFREARLHVFRHRRGMLFASSIRPRPFAGERAGVSPTVNAILEAIGTKPAINRKELFEKLIMDPPSEDAESRKLGLASDLHWLISEGYIIEFNDGSLDLPRAKPKPKEVEMAVVQAADQNLALVAASTSRPLSELEIGGS